MYCNIMYYLIQSSTGVYRTVLYNSVHNFGDWSDEIRIAKLQSKKSQSYHCHLNVPLKLSLYSRPF